MSMRCLVVFLLLGLGIHGPAMGLNLSGSFDKRTSGMSAKMTWQVQKASEMIRNSSGPAQPTPAMRWSDGQKLGVFIHHQCALDELLDAIRNGGQILNHSRFGITSAELSPDALDQVADRLCVRQVAEPVYAHTQVGSVTSAGDIVMRAEELRTELGVNGSNIRIGIISDSLTNLQTSVDSGDLPPDVIIVNGRDGSEIPGIIDEGRAMAELIHDLAPGATLLFHTGFSTNLDMIAAIEALTAAGAHIIVDDLGFFGEPYFEDGPVAQAVQAAIDAGVLYITAVGNDAEANYSGTFQEFDPNDGDPQNNWHDFGGGDATMGVTIASGGFFQAVLQWPNPFDGSDNTADYDLLVLNAAGTADACLTTGILGTCSGLNQQAGTQLSPIESIFVQNDTGQAVSVNLVINRFFGEVLPLRMVFSGNFFIDEHGVSDRSVFGHPCVREAMSVGAINAADPGFDTIETFSSRGPCEIFFTSASASPQVASAAAHGVHTSQVVALSPPEIRDKPDVVAADGTNTSLPFFAPFFGTSAAAPHAAAVAALLMELGGGPAAISAAEILHLMRMAAVDQGEPGVDDTYGFGVVDAVQAADMLQAASEMPPQATITSPTGDVIVTSGATVSFQGACTDAEGNGPFTFAWDFGGGANIASSTAQNPSVIFTLPGAFTVSMTCRNVLGITSLAATIRVLVNSTDDGEGGGVTAAAGGGSGGGGCVLVAGVSSHPLSALGNMFLPILTLCGLWIWRRWRVKH